MLQWNRILKLIRDADESTIAVRDLALDLDLKVGDPDLEQTVQYLKRKGYITVVLGGTRSKSLGVVATITEQGKTPRELLGDKEEEKPNDWAEKYNKQIKKMKD